MNGKWKQISVAIAFTVQLGVLFFWGGNIDTKVERLQSDMTHMRGSYTEVSSSVSDLRLRVSVIEEVSDMCESMADARAGVGDNGE